MAEEATINFFERLLALQQKTPRLYNINLGCENSEYCTHADKMKNSYMVFAYYNSKDCFGCVGLKNKEYCILNKPYSREEYFKKIAEIKTQLRRDNAYGKWHFPSTYKFEDTAAAK